MPLKYYGEDRAPTPIQNTQNSVYVYDRPIPAKYRVVQTYSQYVPRLAYSDIPVTTVEYPQFLTRNDMIMGPVRRRSKPRTSGFGLRRSSRSRVKRGGAISDYIPSLGTVASYVPGYSTAKGYYDQANQVYGDAKEIYDTAKPLYDAYRKLKAPPGPPPIPDSGPPELSAADKKHNERLRKESSRSRTDIKNPFLLAPPPGFGADQERLRSNIPDPMIRGTNLQTVLDAGRKYKPISFIDNALQRFGQRDRVRGFLSKSKLGSAAVSLADEAIKQGFGRLKIPKIKRYAKRFYYRRA